MTGKIKSGNYKTRSLMIIAIDDMYYAGKKQRDIAIKAGVSESTVSRILHGRNEKSRMQ